MRKGAPKNACPHEIRRRRAQGLSRLCSRERLSPRSLARMSRAYYSTAAERTPVLARSPAALRYTLRRNARVSGGTRWHSTPSHTIGHRDSAAALRCQSAAECARAFSSRKMRGKKLCTCVRVGRTKNPAMFRRHAHTQKKQEFSTLIKKT